MHKVSDEPHSDQMKMIRAYLLGVLSQEDQERVEQRLLVDEEFFEEASIVEEEIIDEYLNETLLEKEEFVRSFLSTSRRRQKVRIAMALQMHISDLEDQAPSKAADQPNTRSWLRIFRAWRRVHSHSVGAA